MDPSTSTTTSDSRAYGNVHATTNVLSIVLPGPKLARGARYLDEAAKYGDDVASSATSGIKLGRSLASTEQMTEAGTIIAGKGSSSPIKVLDDLIGRYGGTADDWVKKSSSSYRGLDDFQFETHWYERISNVIRYEMKTNIVRW